MFGNKENDGFLDGLARYLTQLGKAAALIVIIAIIYDDFNRAWKTKNYTKLFIYFAIIFSLVFYVQYQKAETERTRTGIDYSNYEFPKEPTKGEEPDWLKNERYW